MDILHGKANQDFLNWLDRQDLAPYRIMFDEVPLIVQTSYIIEWLDSVGIFIQDLNSAELGSEKMEFDCDIKYSGKFISSDAFSKTRIEAKMKAIKKSIEIYNNQ